MMMYASCWYYMTLYSMLLYNIVPLYRHTVAAEGLKQSIVVGQSVSGWSSKMRMAALVSKQDQSNAPCQSH